jgi:hypothetical protein
MKIHRFREYTCKLGNFEMVKFAASAEAELDEIPDAKGDPEKAFEHLDALLDRALDPELQAAYELTDAESFVLEMFDTDEKETRR